MRRIKRNRGGECVRGEILARIRVLTLLGDPPNFALDCLVFEKTKARIRDRG